MQNPSEEFQKKTRRALLWMNLSHEPFVVLYALLPFILRKDLHASLLQISTLSALRPILPVFSFYWSAHLARRPNHLRATLISAWVLARLPFLFIPWIDNVWYLIFCCGVYELFNKSGIPALIEILKINLPKKTRETTFTLYFVFTFLESILLGFLIANFLDRYSSAWQILVALTALLGLSSIALQLRVPLPEIPAQLPPPADTGKKFVLIPYILQPWKEAFALLKKDAAFARFQWGFMVGGFSLMLVAPALSIFYADHLDLSHSQVVMGRSILMGGGIVLSSYFWQKSLDKQRVPQITRWILLGFALYLFSLSLASVHLAWFYTAFILYGVAQAGSHLLWNLSGTLFASSEDSAPFSRLNILMLGLRGAIAPALGGILCNLFGPVPILLGGGALCLAGVAFMFLPRTQPIAVSE